MSPPAPRLLPSSGLASPLPPCSSPFLTTSIVLRTVGSITQPRARERWASLACPPPLPIPACPLPPAQKRPRQKVRMEAQHQQPPQQSSSDTRASGSCMLAVEVGKGRLAGEGWLAMAAGHWLVPVGERGRGRHMSAATNIRCPKPKSDCVLSQWSVLDGGWCMG